MLLKNIAPGMMTCQHNDQSPHASTSHSSSSSSAPAEPSTETKLKTLRTSLRSSNHHQCHNDKIKQLFLPWVTILLITLLVTAFTISRPQVPDEDRNLSMQNDVHKDLLPLNSTDITGFFCCIVGLMIAAGGGIGGGGILVPIYILVMGFSPKNAIPLSNITVFGGAIANTILNTRKRHPLADRPLVDWDLILVMEPLTIAGALIGAFLNKLLNEILLTVMLVLLLGFTSYNTLKKAFKMYTRESCKMKDEQEYEKCSELMEMVDGIHDEGEEDAAESPKEDIKGEGDEVGRWEEPEKAGELQKILEEETVAPFDSIDTEAGEDEVDNWDEAERAKKLQQILEEEKVAPFGNIVVLVAMFLVVLFINLMKGGGAFKSPVGIECGSPVFWMANAIMLAWIITISMFARSYLMGRHEIKEKVEYPYVEGDIQWDWYSTLTYPVICCFAGFFAGMFGVGGGIVKGPLMLAMGVHPAVSSATSACMILFTSFTATTSFVVFGLLIFDYGAICLTIGFVATLVGQIVWNHLMTKYERNSYIAFSIGIVVLLSAFLMTVQSIVSIVEGTEHTEHHAGVCG